MFRYETISIAGTGAIVVTDRLTGKSQYCLGVQGCAPMGQKLPGPTCQSLQAEAQAARVEAEAVDGSPAEPFFDVATFIARHHPDRPECIPSAHSAAPPLEPLKLNPIAQARAAAIPPGVEHDLAELKATTPADQALWQNYRDGGLSFSYPPGWRVQNFAAVSLIVNVVTPDGTTDCRIDSVPIPDGVTEAAKDAIFAAPFTEAGWRAIQHSIPPDLQVIESITLTLQNRRAQFAVLAASSIKVRMAALYTMTPHREWIMHCAAPAAAYQQWEETFMQVMSSAVFPDADVVRTQVRVLPPAPPPTKRAATPHHHH